MALDCTNLALSTPYDYSKIIGKFSDYCLTNRKKFRLYKALKGTMPTKTKPETPETMTTHNRNNPYTRTRRNYDDETRQILFAKDREINRLHELLEQAECRSLDGAGFIAGLIIGIAATAIAVVFFF